MINIIGYIFSFGMLCLMLKCWHVWWCFNKWIAIIVPGICIFLFYLGATK